MSLFIRVSLSWFLFEPAKTSFENVCSKMAVYEHNDDPDNIHIHIYMENVTVSTDTLKNYIKKVTRPAKGNGFWSFKTAHDDGCIVYMTKGNLEPVFVKGYTNEEINAYRGKYVPRTSKGSGKVMYVVKESQKESKLRQSEMVTEIIKRLKAKDDYTPQDILEQIRQVVIIEQNTIIGRYKVRDYFDTIRARLMTKAMWISEMKNFVAFSI